MTASANTPGNDPDADQQRSNVRIVPHDMQCVVRMRGRSPVQCQITDLSGTGCGFIITPPVSVHDHGQIAIPFSDWTLESDFVVRFSERRGAVSSSTGVSFESLLRNDVDRVVREIFVMQRQQLQQNRRRSR